MFYKVLKNNRVIDILSKLIYLKYQPRHKIMIICNEDDAQAILSSDGNYIWHVPELYNIPVDGYDTVELVEIDQYEYDELKYLNCKTREEIIDEYTKNLIKTGIL